MSSLLEMLKEPKKDHWFAFGAAWTGWVLDAFDFTIFLLVMPQIAKDFGVQHTATAGSIALTLLAGTPVTVITQVTVPFKLNQ